MKDRVSVSSSVSSSISSSKLLSGYLSRFQSLKRSWLIGGMTAALFAAQAQALEESLADVGAVSDTPLQNISRSFTALFSSANSVENASANSAANSSANSSANREVTLRWQAAYNATHYRVEQSTDDGQTFTAFAPVNTTEKALSLAPGLYHFRVMSCIEHHRTLEVLCDGVGQYSGVLAFDSRVDEDNNATLDWAQLSTPSSAEVPSAVLPEVSPTTTNFYGATPGEAGVSGGAAVYQVPIVVVPGRNGMQPSVSLNYNSRNGNGIAGVGFGLSAGGSISRCPATRAQDGFHAGVDYSDSDRLCLDGQRLMVVSGTYGADGAVYRTEMESLLSVAQTGELNATSDSSSGDDPINATPASFLVSAPNGTERRYGHSAASRVVATGKTDPFSWLLDRETDISGNNHLSYAYHDEGDGEVLLSEIIYTGNGTVDGNRKVLFDYAPRAQFATQYLAGGKTRTTQRLKQISTWYGKTKVRDYLLHYGGSSPASGRSLLRSVQECAYQPNAQTQCRTASQFNWSDSAPVFNVEVFQSTSGQEVFPSHLDYFEESVLNRFRASEGDINGDGVRDWPGYNVIEGVSQGTTMFLNAEGQLTGQSDVVVKESVFDTTTFSPNSVTADINLDGRTDHWDADSGLLVIGYTQESSPGTFTVAYTGITDIPVDTTNGSESVVFTGDFNTDGWPDIVIRRETKAQGDQFTARFYLHLHTQQTKRPYQPQSSAFFSEFNSGGRSLRASLLNDMNGDGVPDILMAHQSLDQLIPVNDTLLLSQLTDDNTLSFTEHNVNFGNASHFSEGYYSAFVDVNADGFADWIGWVDFDKDQDNTLQIKFNLGNGEFGPLVDTGYVLPMELVAPIGGSAVDQMKERYTSIGLGGSLLDINNDGRPEILVPGKADADILVEHCVTVQDYRPEGTKSVDICGNDFGKKQFRTAKISDQRSTLAPSLDRSIRKLKALSFIEDSAGDYTLVSRDTDLVGTRGQTVIDAYGKGLMDVIFGYGCQVSQHCFFREPQSGSVMDGAALNTYYITRNYGAATNPTALETDEIETDDLETSDYVPTDMLLGVDNGLRTVSHWVHRPLSSDQYQISHGTHSTPFYQTNFTEVVDGAPQGEQIHFASSMYAVAEFITTDSSQVQQHRRFAYDGAVYNLQGRGFRGFNGIIDIDLTNGLTTYTDFKQTFPFSSAIEKQYLFEGTDVDVHSAIERNRALREISQDWQRNPNQPILWQQAGVYQLFNAEHDTINRVLSSDELALGNQTSRVTVTQASDDIDAYGNVEKRTTAVTDEFGTYTTEEETDFSDASDTWPTRFESRTVVKPAVTRTAGITDVTTDDASELDDDKTVTTTVTWNATYRQPQKVAVSIGTDTDADDAAVITETETDYNDYGLPRTITVTGQVLSGPQDTPQQQQRITTTTYSDNGDTAALDGYFPLTITQRVNSAVSHHTTAHTQPHTGLPTVVTDIAGVQTSTTYDALARPITISRTGFPDQHLRYSAIALNDDNLLNKAVMSIDTFQAGAPNTREFKDSSGRALRLATVGFNGNDIYQDTHYNTRGLLISETQPYSADNDSAENTNAAVATRYLNFDALGRVQQKHLPQVDGTLITDYQYNGLTTDITVRPSKNGAQPLELSRTYNALEQLVRTTDANGGVTQYAYDSAGNPIVIEDANGNRILAYYDALGRKHWVDDPNQGRTDFTYNGFGELEKEIDANGDTLRYDMDALGRVTSRTVTLASATSANTTTSSTANFVWDTQKHGLLSSQSANGSSQHYTYDSAARLTATTTRIDGTDYRVQTQYDKHFGRPLSLSYPGADTSDGGLKITYQYNSHGYLSHEKNAETDFIYREITAQDVFGNIQDAQLNAGTLTGHYAYSGRTGQMLHTRVQHQHTDVHYLGYTAYDGYGNLAHQTNYATTLTSAGEATEEHYKYDNLHRLTRSSITLSGATEHIDYAYDAVGNITKKTDYSADQDNAYRYTSGSNQISHITLKDNHITSFGYDFKGNQTHRNNTREVTYNVFNKPTRITKNRTDITLAYGADLARFKQTRVVDGETITTHYIDKLYEVEMTAGKRRQKHYISDVAILTNDDTTGFSLAFTHRDRLGSATTFTDHNNHVTARRHFDPFGKPRGGDWSQLEQLTGNLGATLGNNPFDSTLATRRGFTDHEHLDEAEIIHMNGRVYDYNVGRFMSVDPVIQAPTNTQSVNPYSYIMNNPLSGTDPTGYCSRGDTLKECTTELKAGETQAITNGEGQTVGHIGKDADGNVHVTNNGSQQGQSAVQTRVNVAGAGGNNADIGGEKSKTVQGQFSDDKSLTVSTSSLIGSPASEQLQGASSISQEGEKFIQTWEAADGPELEIYKDSVGLLTIGFGHKLTKEEIESGVFDKGISEKQAIELFRKDSQSVESDINRLVKVPLSQGQYDAIASLIFNVGATRFSKYNLLKKLNHGDYKGALNEFSDINKTRNIKNGKLIFNPGLSRRRRAEMQLFKESIYEKNN